MFNNWKSLIIHKDLMKNTNVSVISLRVSQNRPMLRVFAKFDTEGRVARIIFLQINGGSGG